MEKSMAKAALTLIAIGMVLMIASPVMAQDNDEATAVAASPAKTDNNDEPAVTGGIFSGKSAANLGGPIGAGLVVMGGAAGIGRIGGSENPWIEGLAAFTIVDPVMKHCGELGDDGCPKPWDFC